MSSLGPTFGRGAMTNPWTDIRSTDLVIIMGGNAAEAHPCGFKWVTYAKEHRGAKLIVVDPRFTRSASVADFYAPIRQGTDIAFLSGVINYCITHDKVQYEYVKHFTNAGLIVNKGFGFKDGLFTGYDEAKRDYDRSTWSYEMDENGYAKNDETLTHPRCVWQLLKKHVSVYTPEMVERICGTPKDKFLKICEMIAECSSPTKAMTSMYALGWTQHSKGAQNIRTMCMLQLILGDIGVRGGGVNALRGHSNIQGLTDVGLMSNLIPGYMNIPMENETNLETYLSKRKFTPTRPNQVSYWQNYDKFFISFMKAMWGKAATKENDFAYDYLPKLDIANYDILKAVDMMDHNQMNGYFCQGFNPVLAFPNRKKVERGLSKLKFLVVMDPLETETARFWENHGDFNDVNTSEIKTEVFQLPTSCFAEDEGAVVNSGRWLQWHWAGQNPPGNAKHDTWIMAQLWLRLKKLYEKEGGVFPDPIVNLHWPYKDASEPQPAELAKEMNGYAVEDLYDPKDPTKKILEKGKQVPGFASLKADGSTASGCWIYSGSFTEDGNMMARRDNTDYDGAGLYPKWTFAWPANRRILYNRASADFDGKAWDPERKVIEWNGEKWTGFDVPDIPPASDPHAVGPFIMNAEGTGRLFTLAGLRDGPFPVHYEPFESPIVNPIAPNIRGNPAARIFDEDLAQLGTSDEFPYAATSYRLTEHFHYWTKNNRINAALQPQFFVEISEELAAEKGVVKGDWVRVWNKRGQVFAKALVTKRIRPIICDGKPVHVIGIPLHWGFIGEAKKGFGPNSLTPFVGDANSQTPEFKAFLVNMEKSKAPVDENGKAEQ